MLTRQDFTTTIRELDGKTVQSLRVRITADDDVLHLLLKVKGGSHHKAFLDTGMLFWTESRDEDDDGEGELRTLPVDGKRIKSITMKQVEDHGVLRIAFDDGTGVTLRSEDEGGEHERTRLDVD